MKLWPRRPAPARPRADHTRIAVLEHDLLGIPPEPGTAAALTVALRRAGTCVQHDPVDVTTFGDPQPSAMCSRCSTCMVLDEHGRWTPARANLNQA
ncbi:hypothetical protein ACH4UY_04880 [Streptomyces longwoodensis]|uniref:hypothetical protein n=1 Tax=Streptomyces longwoodensis TaxID=68231 RepID=UPI0037B1616A